MSTEQSRRVRQPQELPAGTPTRRCVIMRESDARLSKTTDTGYSVRPEFNTPPCYEPRGEEAQDRGREEEPVEPVWSESAVHSTGATILDSKASSTAGEPTEASEAGEPMGMEQVENVVPCEMEPGVAGDISEARAEVTSRIEKNAVGELVEARAAGGPPEACAAGAADASATGTGVSGEQAVGISSSAVTSSEQAGGAWQSVGVSPSATAFSGQVEDV